MSEMMEALQALAAEKGISVFRSYVGEYCTSLEMAGAHISLLKVDDELKELLEAEEARGVLREEWRHGNPGRERRREILDQALEVVRTLRTRPVG